MKFNLIYIYIFVFLFSCTQDMKIIKKQTKIIEPSYSSKGFALIYEDSIFDKKIINKRIIFYKFIPRLAVNYYY